MAFEKNGMTANELAFNTAATDEDLQNVIDNEDSSREAVRVARERLNARRKYNNVVRMPKNN